MPAVQGSGRFRALSIPELVDAAFTLFRRNFLLIVAIAALVEIPAALVYFVVSRSTDYAAHLDNLNQLSSASSRQGGLTQSQRDQFTSDLTSLAVFFAATLVINYVVVQLLGRAATTRAVSDRYLDRPSSVGGSYRVALRALLPLLGAGLIQLLTFGGVAAVVVLLAIAAGPSSAPAVLVLGAFLLVPLVVVYIRWSLVAQTVVIEGLGALRALGRSWALTRHRFWRTFWLYLLLGVITAIISGVLTALVNAFIPGGSTSTGALGAQAAVNAVVGVVVAPVTLIASTLYYYDLRIRGEAFDLQMLAESL